MAARSGIRDPLRSHVRRTRVLGLDRRRVRAKPADAEELRAVARDCAGDAAMMGRQAASRAGIERVAGAGPCDGLDRACGAERGGRRRRYEARDSGYQKRRLGMTGDVRARIRRAVPGMLHHGLNSSAPTSGWPSLRGSPSKSSASGAGPAIPVFTAELPASAR